MSDTDLMKKLLDGTLDPVELENNPHLYVLAERIYGREALEEMGVTGPKIDSYSVTDENNAFSSDVEIPEFVRQVRKKTVPEDLELKAPLPTWCVGVGVLSVLLGVEVGCHQSPRPCDAEHG